MPQYYTGYNPERAFSDGMMTGYDFVDRIRSRRRALDLEERQQARADRGMELAENADVRATESHQLATEDARLRLDALPGHLEQQRRLSDLAIDDTEFRVGRNPTLATQQDAQHALSMDTGRAHLAAAREALSNARAHRKSLAEISALELRAADAERDAAATTPTTPGMQFTQSAVPSQAEAGAVEQSGPVDLRKIPDPPTLGQKIVGAVQAFRQERRERSARTFWTTAADPNKSLLHGVRRNPAPFVDQYQKDRKFLDPQNRASWDLTISNTLTENGKPIPAWLSEPVAPATTREIVADVFPNSKSVKASDPRLIAAAETAVGLSEAGDIPTMTSNQARLMTTQLARFGAQQKLTPEQVRVVTEAARNGAISLEQVRNYAHFGTAFAPASPKIHNFGKGVGLMEFPGGRYAWLQAPGSEGPTNTKAASQVFSDLEKDFNGFIVGGQIEGDPEKPHGRMLASNAVALLTANAPQFEQQTGIRVLDAGGELDMAAFKNPQYRRVLIDWANNVVKGERNPTDSALSIPNQDNAGALIPTAPNSIPIGAVVDGYRYIGGPSNKAESWELVN
jgi:hypothetical protein